MKYYKHKLLILFYITLGFAMQAQELKTPTYPEKAEKYFYAFEINDVLCGYIERDVKPIKEDGKKLLQSVEKGTVLQSVLGGQVDINLNVIWKLNMRTGNLVYLDSDIRQAEIKLGSTVKIDGLSVSHISKLDGKSKEIFLTKDVILDNGMYYTFLINNIGDLVTEKSYEVFESTQGEIEKRTYKLIGEEEIKLAGKKYKTHKISEVHNKTGITANLWIEENSGFLLQRVFSTGRKIYLSERSIVKKIQVAKMDDLMFARVDKVIKNIQELSYMKIKAKIRSAGEWLTPDSLNRPGQKFTGTVEDNLIDGIFEISYKKYDGSGAPEFPTDYSKNESLKKYLEPEDYIESDDPVLIKKAKEITKAANNSWDAAKLISEWVSKNISYAIPGGGTARKTYDSGNGECGAHSRLLAAFCRAAGIPAKFVIGCMYTSTYGGSFGQHAWNEIYMGDAGWIPVDATAFEVDYVDSGHLRLGEQTSFNPVEMKILDYKIGVQPDMKDVEIPEEYRAYTGEYVNIDSGDIFKVMYKDGGLIVDIPGQMKMPLKNPDENGFWYARITNQLYFSFDKNKSGVVKNMHLFQLIPAPKKSSPEEIDNNVPGKFKPYLGKYYFPAIMAELKVHYRDSTLVVDDPTVGMTIRLQAPDKNGKWMDEFNQNGVIFIFNDEGVITELNVCSELILPKEKK